MFSRIKKIYKEKVAPVFSRMKATLKEEVPLLFVITEFAERNAVPIFLSLGRVASNVGATKFTTDSSNDYLSNDQGLSLPDIYIFLMLTINLTNNGVTNTITRVPAMFKRYHDENNITADDTEDDQDVAEEDNLIENEEQQPALNQPEITIITTPANNITDIDRPKVPAPYKITIRNGLYKLFSNSNKTSTVFSANSSYLGGTKLLLLMAGINYAKDHPDVGVVVAIQLGAITFAICNLYSSISYQLPPAQSNAKGWVNWSMNITQREKHLVPKLPSHEELQDKTYLDSFIFTTEHPPKAYYISQTGQDQTLPIPSAELQAIIKQIKTYNKSRSKHENFKLTAKQDQQLEKMITDTGYSMDRPKSESSKWNDLKRYRKAIAVSLFSVIADPCVAFFTTTSSLKTVPYLQEGLDYLHPDLGNTIILILSACSSGTSFFFSCFTNIPAVYTHLSQGNKYDTSYLPWHGKALYNVACGSGVIDSVMTGVASFIGVVRTGHTLAGWSTTGAALMAPASLCAISKGIGNYAFNTNLGSIRTLIMIYGEPPKELKSEQSDSESNTPPTDELIDEPIDPTKTDALLADSAAHENGMTSDHESLSESNSDSNSESESDSDDETKLLRGNSSQPKTITGQHNTASSSPNNSLIRQPDHRLASQNGNAVFNHRRNKRRPQHLMVIEPQTLFAMTL